MRGIEQVHCPTQSNSCDQGEGQLDSIVAMKLHFREQVAKRDAKKNSRRYGQGAADDQRLIASEFVNSQNEEDGSEGTNQGKNGIRPRY